MFLSPRISTKTFIPENSLMQTQKDLIKSLESNLKVASVENFHHLTSLNFPERPKPNKKSYALDLLRQIEDKHEKSKKEKQENLKDLKPEGKISTLNFPITPVEVKRKRDKEKQLKVKLELENQIDFRNSLLKNEKKTKVENEKKEINELMKKFYDDEKDKIESLRKEKIMLMESWNSQVKVKDLQTQFINLESKGFNPRARSVLNKVKEEIIVPIVNVSLDKEKVEGNYKNKEVNTEFEVDLLTELRPIKKKTYLEKVEMLKDRLDEKYKNSAQWKIKKILDQVKESRKIKSNSLSSARFNAQKKPNYS